MSKRGSGSSARAGGGPKNGEYGTGEHEFDRWREGHYVNGYWIPGGWVTDYDKMNAAKEKKLATIVDNSRYKKSHNETIDFVKKQVGVDLNKYRTGDGSTPDMTTFWEKGPKVAFDFKKMSRGDWDKLMQLTTKPYGVTFEQGNAWIGYISRKKKK